MSNPLVAQAQSSTTAYSGVSLLESAHDLNSAIQSGDWASVAMGSVGTALDALSMAMDPFGAILAAGVGWLMEHIGPLKSALDALAGNPDQIKANSETWANIAKELGSIGDDLVSMANKDTASWTGQAGDAYRQRAADLSALLGSAKEGSEGASSGVKTAGEVVAAVRSLVRDIIAELVGHMISWALQVVFTLGIGLTWVVPQVVAAVAKTASQIASITTKLVKALKALVPLLKKAGDLFADAAKALKNIKPGKAAPSAKPGDLPPGPKGGGTPKGGDGATSPSGSTPDPTPPPKADPPPAPKSDPAPPPKSDPDGSTTPSSAKPDPTPPPKTDPAPPPKTDPPPKADPPPAASPPPAPKPDAPAGGTPKGSPDGGGTPKSDPKADNPRDRAVPDDSKVCVSDPVDVASGEVVMTQIDLTLPGETEDLVLSRTHLSSYRAGRWFGRSWASTLDQRLEVGREQIRFYAEDGMVLVYPLPAGEPVLPLEGPRNPLHRTADGYRLSTGDAELHFAGTGSTVPLTAIEQKDSRTEIEHAEDGTPTALRRNDGVQLQISTSDGRVVALGAPEAAPLVRFGYNRLGQLTTIANFAGRPMTLDYDFEDRLVGWQDRTGTWYRYVYDAAGRCVRTAGANGYYNATFAYETGITRHTDALGHTWTYLLNDAKQLVERTDPLGNSRRYSWSRYDHLQSEVDELGRETRYTYENGELTAVIRPDGSVVRTASIADGEVQLRVGEGDSAIQRVVAASDPFDGLPGAAVSAGPSAAPDPLGDEPVTDGSVRPGDRDLFGRPQLVHTASGGAARLGWTAEGRRAWRIGPHGDRETWLHDAEGQVVEHRDAAGGVRRRSYGPFGLALEDVDATGARTAYAYDGELRLTSVTNPQGLTWRYTYDAAGRLVEETDFDGRRLTYAYDEGGQLRRMTNGLGQPIEYDYDLLGNVVERRTAEEVTRYVYDALGRLVLAENPEARLEIIRDERGRVVAETVNGLGVCWDYDGTVLRRRTSSGVDSEWTFDEAGLPRSLRIAGHDVGFEHDQAGREVVRSVDRTVVLRRRFDEEDRLAAEEIAGVGQRTYGYRPDGRLAAVDDVTRPWRLEFDQAGRVNEVHGPGGVERFAHDAAGTVTSAATPSLPGPRAYRGNTLISAGGTSYTADAQGRVTGRHRAGPDGGQSWNYSWDQLDRMRDVRTSDGARWTYHYDPLGRRFAKRRWVTGPDGEAELAGDTRFLWSGTDLVERVELGADGSSRILTWERHPGDSRPVVQVERSEAQSRFRAIITSPAGTPTELLDETGKLVWQDRSSFWGAPLPGSEGAVVPLAFPGQHRDEETGLHYNVFRYYDPETARYLSQDPLGLAAAPDPVGYVAEPLLVGDPLGLVSACGKTGGAQAPKRPRPDDLEQHPDLQPPPAKKPDLSPGVFRMTPEEFDKFKPQLDQMMRADKHFFWSGGYKQGPGTPDDPYLGSIEMKANSVAKQNGGNTLEGLVADNNLKMPGWNPNDAEVGRKWTDASETFAKNSNADTHVVFPDKPGSVTSTGIPNPNGDIYAYRRPDNVFDVTEYPKLDEQGISVTEHNAETGATRPYVKPPARP
jgi:RHS repeat-associated protein